MVKVMLDILLPRPDQLYRPVEAFGDLHDLGDEVLLEAATEAAPQEGRVDVDAIVTASEKLSPYLADAALDLRLSEPLSDAESRAG